MRLRSYDGKKEFTLNVLQFRSPMSAAINSVQTRTMLQHFPIRCGQPDIEFTVQFAHREEKTVFQAFVREHQVKALGVTGTGNREVTLWWPERNISNWSGYISSFQVAERRFDNSPRVTFGVDLVESMMSVRTTTSSIGAGWMAIWGNQIGESTPQDSILTPPTPPAPPVVIGDPIDNIPQGGGDIGGGAGGTGGGGGGGGGVGGGGSW